MATITDLSQLDLNGTYSYADYIKWRLMSVSNYYGEKLPVCRPRPT